MRKLSNNNRLWYSLIALVAALAWHVQAHARAYDRTFDVVVDSGFIEVAVYKDFAPYSFMEDGQARGIDVEIARHVAQAFDVDLKVRWVIPDETLDDDLRNHVWKGHYLGGGVADVMMRVPYDREFAYMTDALGEVKNDLVVMFGPYHKERWRILYDPDQLDAFSTLAVFQYDRIGVEIDSLPDFYLMSVFGGRLRGNVEHFMNLMEAVDAMEQGKVAAVMGMESQVEWLREQYKGQFKVADVSFMGITKQQWELGMAVRENHRQLGYEVTEVVAELIRSGQMEEIFAKYDLSYEMPELYRVELMSQ